MCPLSCLRVVYAVVMFDHLNLGLLEGDHSLNRYRTTALLSNGKRAVDHIQVPTKCTLEVVLSGQTFGRCSAGYGI